MLKYHEDKDYSLKNLWNPCSIHWGNIMVICIIDVIISVQKYAVLSPSQVFNYFIFTKTDEIDTITIHILLIRKQSHRIVK